MPLRLPLLLPLLAAGLLVAAAAGAGGGKWDISPGRFELSGHVAVEAWAFPEAGMQSGQSRSDVSVSARPELYAEWQDGRKRLLLVPFVRLDQRDDQRTKFDLREFHLQMVEDGWDLKVGIGKVFWGVTEALHVVDIVNQSDIAERADGDAKLGQPMVNFNLHRDWGSLEMFVLPGFRERTFTGKDGRPRTAERPDTEIDAAYQSGARRRHVDFAVRWSQALGDLDFALSQFWGTSREPVFERGTNPGGESVLIPRYDIIAQTGLELQYTRSGTLWKGEAAFRTGQLDDFVVLDVGLEHTLVGLIGAADVGLLAEYIYQSRPLNRSDGKLYFNSLSNDIMVGVRFTLNDVDATEGLITATFDLESSAKLFSVELSRRIGDGLKVKLEGSILSGLPADEPLFTMREDDFLRIALEYYF